MKQPHVSIPAEHGFQLHKERAWQNESQEERACDSNLWWLGVFTRGAAPVLWLGPR